MRRALRRVGQALAIVAITLALDFVLTATLFDRVKRALSDAEAGNQLVYRPVPYHHDLIADIKSNRLWGNIVFPWQTDRYGFRAGRCAPGESEKGWPAIFVVGDSFVEAVGSSYEQSFVGLMACDAARQNKAVWNLGVASYSPVIYHAKIRAAAERLGVRPAEIYVFLDLSDIDDDANIYRVEADGTVTYAAAGGRPMERFDLGRFLIGNFTSVRLLHDLYLTSSFNHAMSLNRPRARWTVDPALMESWGRRGLEVAGANLDRIVAICRDWHCRMTLVVYPWPDNVVAGDRDSIQVRHWRDWAAARGVRFVDGFAAFFAEPAEMALRKYFIAGDIHYTELGNRLLYEAVRTAVGGDW
ncbi:MAG: SGNH/GDSL hydrolase family protein [Reyranella sp.]|nr:SGNH/GDSL hydrolase family protein [Reyranella sp.]